MRPCVICGKDKDLVGEVHRCEPVAPIETKALGRDVVTVRPAPKPVRATVVQTSPVTVIPSGETICPVCAARRERRRLAQRRYMDKLRQR